MSFLDNTENTLFFKEEPPNNEERKVCRICVKESSEYHNILKENEQECLLQYFGIVVQNSDNWPKRICSICYDQMKIAVKFLTKIRASEELLFTLFGNLRQINPNQGVESEKEKSPNEMPTSAFEIEREISNDEDSSQGDPLSTESPPKTPPKRKNRKRDKQLYRIEEFFKMDCDLCGKSHKKLKDLQAHFRQEHKQKAYVVCCRSKFRHKCKIQEHMELHLNPDAFRCVECGKVSKTKYNLHLHMQNSHTPREFHKFMCDKCPATFMTMERYKKHTYVHIPNEEKTNKCPKCSKVFSFKANLRIHIEQVHNKGPIEHICEVCAKVFKNREVFLRHAKTHCKERLRKFTCKSCDKKFVYEYHLKRHILRHNDSGETFVCHICGKNAPNGPALNAHINYVHVRERIHKCGQCESAFKTPRALRQHIICHHTGEVLYFCIFCNKRFKCRTSKYFHQKHQHPDEYKELQEKKKFSSVSV